ncbi:glycosyltransferase [Paraflavitalea pollutisoli]|uniref:glycosyltransferase n=1 Tax=Paraflavitalea pollutisoli TaxID=3034143 RepID=UPI0023EE0916|nr:glycosyltransferase [Paraflavitalea sp. H1-2-19X]
MLTITTTEKREEPSVVRNGTYPVGKVLFVIDTLEVGGAEQSLLDLVTRFSTLEPVVCHVYAGETLKPQFTASGIRVRSIGLRQKYGWVTAYQKLKAVLQEEAPDLVVAYLTRSELLSRVLCRQLHIPVMGTFVSDLYGKSYNHSLSRKAQWGVAFFKWLNRITAGYCAGFIANSESIAQANAAQLGIPAAKIQVINRGRDSRRFVFKPRTVLPGKPIRFLHVGRLVPVKGHHDLLHAFHAFVQQHPAAQLHLAGEGPERSGLTQLMTQLGLSGNVQLLGIRTDIPMLLQQYDCFVFPSLSEGFSGAVVEAMLSGLPVLASAIPANKEVLQHLQTGYLFSSNEVASLTAALHWFQAHRAEALTMAAAAHTYALEHFELDDIAARMEAYLQTIIAHLA